MKWLNFFKIDLSKGGRCRSSELPPPPPYPSHKLNPLPEKKPKGRLVPSKCMDGVYDVEVYEESLKDFIKIDSVKAEWHGILLIQEFFENKEIKKRGIVYVY